MAGIVTGEDAFIYLGDESVDIYGYSDFEINTTRGVVEQPLVGKPGNYFKYGALNVDGSLTMCKFASDTKHDALTSIVESNVVKVSGGTHSAGLSWYVVSGQVTNYTVTFGNADTITEASIDWQCLDPYNVSYAAGLITDA